MPDPPPQPRRDPFAGLTGVYYHANHLWILADRLTTAVEKAEAEKDPDRTGPGLSAILFAAFSIETFLNELAELADQHRQKESAAAALHAALDAAEEGHSSVRVKIRLACLALTGKPADMGGPPFQDVALLFKVRDEVVHCKPRHHKFTEGAVEVEPKKLFATIFQKKLIADPSSRPAQSVLGMIATAAFCRWSVDTAHDVIRGLTERIPNGDLARRVKMLTKEAGGWEPKEWGA